ncbi:putative membrane protein [Rubrobacter radiotolerans]|uniref:Putative membrane protein n=1 Tax=Rubrobacter radiotolerans TaxID=42256 RepID=A0A023X3V5_RUBRA|nr:hypothetical protein [Rubrobacter radiotolerans]AHY47142.1 putative membrane protein [Rubrobacter radiotolerans]MDX5894548.1 hypothetical protein [Rubrobacter radiotolerans]SMC06231.1 Uncharacterized membrane protein [Rubrobacter radiotolerans DSM 5868]
MPSRDAEPVNALSQDVLEVLALAALSGFRAAAPPALLARAVRRGDLPTLEGTSLGRLGSASNVFLALMIGEMIADKTPFIPARFAPGPAFGRALSGGLVGAALSVSRGRGVASGAIAGGAAALAGLYAADRARKWASGSANLPDPLWGALEDALVLFAGSRLTRERRP